MTAAGLHPADLAGGRWNRPGIGWGAPVEGQAPIGPTKSPPRVEGSGVCPILTRRDRLGVNDLSAIIHCRLVSHGFVVRISAFGAPRVPWSDMAFWLQTASTSRLLLPHSTSSFCGYFFTYVMTSVVNYRCCTVPRQKDGICLIRFLS